MRVMRGLRGLAIVVPLLLLITTRAEAVYIDLTTSGASGVINGATFTQGGALSGTGVFPAFVQIGGNDAIHDAYNTTVNNVLDNGNSPTFNHEIRVADIPILTVGGVSYYSFFLDINESNNATDKFLSLDALAVLTSTTANQSSTPLPVGISRYDMGTGNGVLLNYGLESGSGRADMEFLLPTSSFAGALGTDFVYLYSKFGVLGSNPSGAPAGDYGASAGFEEWALGRGEPGTPVPEPATLLLLGSGLAGLGWFGRKRSTKQDTN